MATTDFNHKFFTEAEVARLTGISEEDLRRLAKERHLGTIACALVAGVRAEHWLFSNADLTSLAAGLP
jgi:hypothetical protein